MEIEVWTIQMARWQVAVARDVPLINIAAKGGIKAFAPDFAAVMAHKRGELSDEEYTEMYLARMKFSIQHYPKRWDSLATRPKAAYACYCRPGAFCHRLLHVQIAKAYLEDKGHIVHLRGEL